MAADIVLTGHSVNSSQRSKYSDRSDRRETNILQVERVFQHPVKRHKQKEFQLLIKQDIWKYAFTNEDPLYPICSSTVTYLISPEGKNWSDF